ncbi:MAG TPA: hypothetical protein ENN28_00445 [Candidatus Uhrbacteria bacterium]|nr:hypothetical protein [Candidatus Uhrbacteria bacterium]
MRKLLFLGLIIGLTIIISGCQAAARDLTPQKAEDQALSFINNYLVEPGNEVSIKDLTDDGSVYKMTVVLKDGSELDAFLSKDGKTFFPQGFDIEEISAEAEALGSEEDDIIINLPKTDRPVVELFVMSHCPYGTQIEKGILPVIELLGDKIDFELKFCDYAMHGQIELNEQMNQYCIQKEQNDKFLAYLSCFLESGDSLACISKTGINQSSLNNCLAKTDKEYQVTSKFEANENWQSGYPPFDVHSEDNEKYEVRGSPTLIINGVQSSTGRDAQSLLNAICSAFNSLPAECSQQLDSATPVPGFGYEVSASANSTAGCGT